MTFFRDTDQLYEILDDLFRHVAAMPALESAMVESGIILRFRYREPDGQVTVDLRQRPISWTFGETDAKPDLEMIQSADTAHEFWLGELNIPLALASRRVVSRGPVRKALALLPALEPAYALYRQVLRERGLPMGTARTNGGHHSWTARARTALEDFSRSLWERSGREEPLDEAALNAHLIPLIDRLPEQRMIYREQDLPSDEDALGRAMLGRMLQIRAFEQLLSEAWARGDVPTEAIHLSIGQEATAVGVCFALRADDHIVTTHRGHGHMLAKGADLDGMMAEILGRRTGLCEGKGGSMHVTDAAVGALGANGIVGASPLIATGAAHSARLRGTDQVAVAFVGDGATNQGMFHEALNFAAVLSLPAVFVIENNLYGEFTAVGRHAHVERLSDRAAAYGLPGVTVDGNDVWAVRAATAEAVAKARRGEGSTVLECLTYRWHGHMEGESVDYRPADEIAAWKERCPIKRLRASLVAGGALDEEAADAIAREAADEVRRSYDKAEADPKPALESLTTDVYAPEPAHLFGGGDRPVPRGRETTTSQALFEALSGEMARDERVYLLGEDVTTGGYFAVTVGLSERFGTDRIVDTPISEYAIVGSAVGAAMTGLRPVAEILFSDFLTTCMDPLVNQAAKLRYMSGGQYTLPLVVRTPGGAGLGMAAQHSQSLEALLTGIPGLLIAAPATPADAKGLLTTAIRSENPVLFFENKLLYAATGPVPEGEHLVPFGVAAVRREGKHVTAVTVGAALLRTLEAAEELARTGIEVEVIDVRTLVPLDLATIVRSVQRTGRLVTVEEGPLGHGFGSEIVARVAEVAHAALRAAPRRVAALDVPLAYDSALENAALPTVERIAETLKATCGHRARRPGHRTFGLRARG